MGVPTRMPVSIQRLDLSELLKNGGLRAGQKAGGKGAMQYSLFPAT